MSEKQSIIIITIIILCNDTGSNGNSAQYDGDSVVSSCGRPNYGTHRGEERGFTPFSGCLHGFLSCWSPPAKSLALYLLNDPSGFVFRFWNMDVLITLARCPSVSPLLITGVQTLLPSICCSSLSITSLASFPLVFRAFLTLTFSVRIRVNHLFTWLLHYAL